MVEPGRTAYVEWASANPTTQSRNAALLVLGIAWLVYTRLYFYLHPRGLTLAPSLFMQLTGRPDPLCGLTRTFAWMWRGDALEAAAVYPLGPLLFVASFPVIGVLCIAVLTRRSPAINFPVPIFRGLAAIGIALLLVNWGMKLVWLGN